MPWKECRQVEERLRFIARLLDGEKMAGPCSARRRFSRRSRPLTIRGIYRDPCKEVRISRVFDKLRRWLVRYDEHSICCGRWYNQSRYERSLHNKIMPFRLRLTPQLYSSAWLRQTVWILRHKDKRFTLDEHKQSPRRALDL